MFRCRFARTAAWAALFGVFITTGTACSKGDPCTLVAPEDVSSWPDPIDLWDGVNDPHVRPPLPTLPPKRTPAQAEPDYVEGCWDCAVRCSLSRNEAEVGETVGGSSQSYDAACRDAIRSLESWAHTLKGSDLARCDYADMPAAE